MDKLLLTPEERGQLWVDVQIDEIRRSAQLEQEPPLQPEELVWGTPLHREVYI